MGASAIGAAATGAMNSPSARAAEPVPADWKITNGKLKQSVVHWCFNPMSVESLAAAAARLGIASVELVSPHEWPTLKKHGLTCAIAGSHGFAKGFAHVEEHAECLVALEKSIAAAAEFGCPSVITFSGFRRKLDLDVGTANMIAGLKKIAGYAEKKGVTVCLEMLNSRVPTEMKGHPDYFCDSIDHSVEIVKKVGSPRVKVLFDIYHVQIMEGDVIERIKQHHEAIGHYHTAGNPGRNDLDDTQELNYPPIMKAIIATGYQGFVGQEFIPRANDSAGKIAALAHGARVCDVA